MKIYFEETNAFRNVIITDGQTAKIFNGAPDGRFDGVDLYSEDFKLVAEKLREHFAGADLNDYEEICSDFEIDFSELADEMDSMIEVY